MQNKPITQLDLDYLGLVDKVINTGKVWKSRQGTWTRSLYGKTLDIDASRGTFPILRCKKVNFDAMLHELMWFLNAVPTKYKFSSDTKRKHPDSEISKYSALGLNIGYLVNNGVQIWTPYAFNQYKKDKMSKGMGYAEMDEFQGLIKYEAMYLKYGFLGKLYGWYWNQTVKAHSPIFNKIVTMTQMDWLLHRIYHNYDERRWVVSCWDPKNQTTAVIPPCHIMFQVLKTGEKELSMNVYQRSADIMLGVPFNISSYGALLHIICNATDHIPGFLNFQYGDLHIYESHVEKAIALVSTEFEVRDIETKLEIEDFTKLVLSLEQYDFQRFQLKNYDPNKFIAFDYFP